jgi:hypothetical protein
MYSFCAFYLKNNPNRCSMSDGSKPVEIKNLQLENLGENQRLSASVDGDTVWFEMSADIPLAARAEAFLAPAMFEAMVRGVPLIVEKGTPISPRLLEQLKTIQSIFTCWNSDLHKVAIEADVAPHPGGIDGGICCFSGGVDSSHTLACHEDEISHLLVVQGFDTWGDKSDWEENVKARMESAKVVGKKLIAVHSNVREFIEARKIYWGLVLGSILGSLGATLAPSVFFIPSSWTYQNLHPFGSHPLVDPQWSTESTRVVHHGADVRRCQKVELLSKHPELLDQLQVCWISCSHNCGECAKCIRTSLTLGLIGVQSANMPPYREISQLKGLRPYNADSLPYIEDLMLACEDYDAPEIWSKLDRMRRGFILKDSAMNFAKALTGTTGQRIYRKLRPQDWHGQRANLLPIRSMY